MVSVFYNPEYVGAAHAFETTRKAKWVADSLGSTPIRGVELVSPSSLSCEQLIQVHDPDYVRAVQTGVPRALAQSQGFDWDAGLWPMVLASNGGAVAAALAALLSGVAGSLSSGLHHAKRARGDGYCTFNGLAIAAHEALAAGAGSVLILDLDAHCGGGTASLIAEEPRIWQVDVSVDSFDRYATSERATLRIVQDGDEYLGEIERVLKEVRRQGPRFGLCLYNAGMDPFEGCATGGLTGITREILAARERLVFDWCREQGLPIAFVLAGGYLGRRLDEEGLVDLHRLTLLTAAAFERKEAPTADPFPEDIRRFVDDERWTYAKTMPDWPHEYLVRERVDRDLFEQTVKHIRSNGYEVASIRGKITYYEEAGLVYWTMGAPLDETIIINRCRKEDSFESRSRNGTLPG